MLPNLNLDDKHFDELVQEALEELHRYSGEWSDHNLHDPGITFIELFAWLSEMQRYYLNRISDKSKENIFKLLGIIKEQKKMAQSKIVLSKLEKDLCLPKGMKFKAGELVFQSLNKQWILANTLKYVHVEVDKKVTDKSRENTYQEIFFYPFGEDIRKNNKLYLGFDHPLPRKKEIDITFSSNMTNSDDDIDNNMFLVDLGWEIYCGNDKWKPVKVLVDETFGLSLSGKLTIMIDDDMKPKKNTESTDDAYWLRAVVKKDYLEIPARLDNIRINMINIEHCNELISTCDFEMKSDRLSYYLDDYLQLFGDNYIQVPVGDYWKDVNKLSNRSFDNMTLDPVKQQLHLEDIRGHKTVRILSFTKGFLENSFVGSSLGLSNQVFELYMPSIVYKSLGVQVGEMIDGELLWKQWTEVDFFDFSKPLDTHFRVDYDKSQLIFGDNVRGMIPDEGYENIRLTAMATGGGFSGNIRENEINSFYCNPDEFHEIYEHKYDVIHIANPMPSAGGRNIESIKDLHKRLLEDINKPYVAVTHEDYEYILSNIPRLKIERSHIIANYDIESHEKNYGHATIVVMPEADYALPMPSHNFKKAVRHYLEPHRLITTKLHIVGPSYVKVDVNVTIVIGESTIMKSSEIVSVLDNLLDPKIYTFGQTIKKSMIYRALSSIEGVKRIEGLTLYTIHRDSKMKANGDIRINDYCVPFSGVHNIDIVVS